MAAFAILVGIEEYPLAGFRPLSGPRNDVALFRRWLVDPAGGNVPDKNIIQLVTTPPTQPVKECPPNVLEFRDKVEALCIDGANGIIRRPNDRIYLYFSGHGFTDFRVETHHAALFAANVRQGVPENLGGTAYANWMRRAAAFGEIVLVMDCCRNEEITKPVYPVPFEDYYDPALAANVKMLEIYAAPAGASAQERLFDDVQRAHGNLTYGLVVALYGSEPVATPGHPAARTATVVKQYLEGIWPDIGGAAAKPRFWLPDQDDISFNQSVARNFGKSVVFQPALTSPASLVVQRDDQPVVSVDLDPGARTARYTSNGSSRTVTFDGHRVCLDLKAAIYTVALQQAGQPERSAVVSMVGDRDAIV